MNIDQARLMPHLRIQARRAKAEVHPVPEPERAGAKSWYQRPVDPRGLRGIPVVGVAAGAIAGTQPEAALLANKQPFPPGKVARAPA
jgi:hypothetical protein